VCRSIKQLRLPDRPPTETELRAAALQFVRKISGFQKPSRANQEAFEAAVDEVALAAERLLQRLAASTSSRTGSSAASR
jgi:hypothetical protein